MEQNLIDIYNPRNASSLTQEQIDNMGKLTDEQIGQLAKAYPNSDSNFAYLILYDENARKQNYARSTWANLYHLRTKNKAKQYSALTFASLWRGGDSTQRKDANVIPMAMTQDISRQEVESAPGINKTQFEQEKVNVENFLASNTKISEPAIEKEASISDPEQNMRIFGNSQEPVKDIANTITSTDNKAEVEQQAQPATKPVKAKGK